MPAMSPVFLIKSPDNHGIIGIFSSIYRNITRQSFKIKDLAVFKRRKSLKWKRKLTTCKRFTILGSASHAYQGLRVPGVADPLAVKAVETLDRFP